MDPHVWLKVHAVYDLAMLTPHVAEELETIPTFRPATVSNERAPISERRPRKSDARISAAGIASGPVG